MDVHDQQVDNWEIHEVTNDAVDISELFLYDEVVKSI